MSDSKNAPSPTPDPLRILLARIAVGEEDALEELYDLTSRRVYGLASAILKDHALAEEAALDTYHHIWKQAGAYQPERATPVRWILIIARTRTLDLRRRRQRVQGKERALDVAFSAPDGGIAPPLRTAVEEEAARVRDALAALPDEQRRALEATFFEGLTHREAAERLDQPLGTIKTRIRSGLAALRALLGEAATS